MHAIESTPEFVARAYAKVENNLETVREPLGRPLTLTEKVLLGHLAPPPCRPTHILAIWRTTWNSLLTRSASGASAAAATPTRTRISTC